MTRHGFPLVVWLATMIFAIVALAAKVQAHEVRPAYLEITQRQDGKLDVVWKQPSVGLLAVAIRPRIDGGLIDRSPDRVEDAENFELHRWNAVNLRGGSLDGRTVRIEGLERTITDVLVLVRLKNGDEESRVLTPAQPSFAIAAHSGAAVPAYLLQIIGRFTRLLRESHSVDQRSGVSARFAIAAAETVAASARHRGAVLGETEPVARVVDLGTVIDVLRGKLEFESGEEGRELAVLDHLLRRATADTAQKALGGIDVGPLVAAVEKSAVTTGEQISATDVLAALPDLPVIESIATKLGARSEGERAAALELALEALYLAKKIDKNSGEGETVYG